jgi:hypothetical protein
VIQPIAVDDTIQHVTAVQLKGVPDMNRRLRLVRTWGLTGSDAALPAGLFSVSL